MLIDSPEKFMLGIRTSHREELQDGVLDILGQAGAARAAAIVAMRLEPEREKRALFWNGAVFGMLLAGGVQAYFARQRGFELGVDVVNELKKGN